MRTSTLLLAMLLLAVTLPAAAQVTDTYIIPAAANGDGARGTRWMTQFSIFNPQLDWPLVVSITYLPTGGGQGTEMLVEVPANSLATSDNILADLFEVQGTGALLVATFPEDNPQVPDETISRAFLVTTNTYNNSRTGTFGQTIPGVWTGLLDYDFDGISAVAHGIRNLASAGWRTNVGAVNLGRCSVTLRINVYDGDGNTLLEGAPLIVPPLGHIQDALPIQVDSSTVEFFVEDPCSSSDANYAVVFPYTSTVDQLSGDPTYQSPALLASPGSIFAKSKLIVDPLQVGMKINTAYARGVRALGEKRGKARLERGAKGWTIKR
jgi:hypothetical protein